MLFFLLGSTAEKSFRNLRNRYGREKRKWKSNNKSGAGAKDVKRPAILDAFGWLESYIIERETTSNWNADDTSVEPTQVESEDEEDKDIEGDEEYGNDDDKGNDSISINSDAPSSPAVTNSKIGSKPSKVLKVSAVTGRMQFQKKTVKRAADLETELMQSLKERLGSKKDEDQLYGDLLATKMRKLSKINKLKAKHEIDNIMFKFQLENVDSSINQQANDLLRSPTLTPVFSQVEASSPVYQPQNHQQQQQYRQQSNNLPNISSLRNFPQYKVAHSNINHMNTYSNYLNNDVSQDQIMNGDLFKSMRKGENDRDKF